MPNPKVHWQYCVDYFDLFSFNLNGWILKIICLTPEVYKCAWMSTHITWLASYFCKLTLHATGKPWNKAKIVGSLCCQCMENWTQKTWFIIYIPLTKNFSLQKTILVCSLAKPGTTRNFRSIIMWLEDWTQKTWFIIYIPLTKIYYLQKTILVWFIGQAWNNQEFWVHYNVACPLWKCNYVLVWACELASCQVALIAKAALENNKFHSPIFTNF